MSFNRLTQDISFISKLADKPNQAGMSATELKAEFDRAGNVIKTFINSMLDTVESTNGAFNIGIQPIGNLIANNVQTALSELNGKATSIIGTSRIGDGAVTKEKIHDAAVTANKIADGNITLEKLNASARSQGIEVSIQFTGLIMTVTVQGVKADSNVLVAPTKESEWLYSEYDVYCSGQDDGTLTFTASAIPNETLIVNVILLA